MASLAAPSAPPASQWSALLDYTNGNGLHACYRFCREPPSMWPPAVASEANASASLLMIDFRNHSQQPFNHVAVSKAQLGADQNR